MLDRKTIALNIMDIEGRIDTIHKELETLHEMKEELRMQLDSSCAPVCTFYENN